MDEVVNPARGESVEGETGQLQSQSLPEEFLRDLEEEDLPERERESHSEDELPDYCRWRLSRHTPEYLLPREGMRFGQTLADPELRQLVEDAWDAKVILHLSLRACNHPGHRADPADQWPDWVIDGERLNRLLLEIGRKVMALAGAGPPEGLWPNLHEVFYRKAGEALLEACYAEGCAAIEVFMGMWCHRDYDGLRALGRISEQECEVLKMWAARDYDGLLRRGVISPAEYEWYEEEDARRAGGR